MKNCVLGLMLMLAIMCSSNDLWGQNIARGRDQLLGFQSEEIDSPKKNTGHVAPVQKHPYVVKSGFMPDHNLLFKGWSLGKADEKTIINGGTNVICTPVEPKLSSREINTSNKASDH